MLGKPGAAMRAALALSTPKVLEMSAASTETHAIKADAACLWPAGAILGEGPVWHRGEGKLYWTDIKGSRLLAYRPENDVREEWRLPCRIGSIGVPAPDWTPPQELAGTPLLACGDAGLMWLGLRGPDVATIPIADPEAHLPENRFNDGKIGPDGRYWAGTMHDPETDATGNLYAFMPDGETALLDTGYRVTNGPAFSPDGRTVYHNDSALQTIYAFDLNPDGTLRNKRVFHQFGPEEGYPDGMTTDCAGNLWVAMWDGARVEKISPQGVRLGHVTVPTPHVTSCAFQGDDETVLYVTSAKIGLDAPDSFAGALFRIRLG